MKSLGYFTLKPRPGVRDMPEMPDVPGRPPVVPDMPDLPPEIPWPPTIDWPEIPGPWTPPPFNPWGGGLDGLPMCWPEFAARLMALMFNAALYRASLGLFPGWPPFDLRTWTVATPQLVNLAVGYFVDLMWNTIGSVAGNVTAYPDTSLADGWASPSASTATYTGNLQLNRFVGLGVAFMGLGIPAGVPITGATFSMTTGALAIGTGTLTMRVRAANTGAAFSDTYISFSGRRAACGSVKSTAWPLGATGEGITLTSPDLASVVSAHVNGGAWSDGITLFVDDFDEETAETVTRNFTNITAFDSISPSKPSLTVAYGVAVERLSGLFVTDLACSRLLSWLAYAEGVCNRYV